MPTSKAVKPKTVKAAKEFARTIESNKVDLMLPFHWLSLAVGDFMRAPLISLIYGMIFSLIPAAILYIFNATENHLVILPSIVAFALIGPAFAAGLYDVAWELEKGHQPTFTHSLKSMFRNPVGEWGFAILLMVIMIAWMRIAALIHALYPNTTDPTLEELMAFLSVGSVIGAMILAVVFTITAFTPQIMIERRVDIMTAIFTSIKAVNNNVGAMMVWGTILIAGVAIGFATFSLGFILIMPILSYASWHGYIAVIKTKRKRKFE